MNKRLAMLIFLLILCSLFTYNSIADDDHGHRKHHKHESHSRISFHESEHEGSENAGQLAAWLLFIANLPVSVSLLIKGSNRYLPLNADFKHNMGHLNRIQKKSLMWLHYFLNIAILFIALWHWITSKCATILPEIGLIMMTVLVVLGFLIKFNLCPQFLRKYAYQIHTQPIIFIIMVLVLAVGHLAVD